MLGPIGSDIFIIRHSNAFYLHFSPLIAVFYFHVYFCQYGASSISSMHSSSMPSNLKRRIYGILSTICKNHRIKSQDRSN